ncbi:MAG: type II secretion system F family protein, partial [Candidatus Portnoybacteria bacterium]|nr:type II secretion system F family protein [Candidatus Portnoybacteria bacterium]
MPSFNYTAVSHSGERKSGTKEAPNASELARALREEGLIMTSANNQQSVISSSFNFRKLLDVFRIFNRVPLVEKMMFARNLAVMVKAGFSLNKALQVLILQTKNKRFIKVITKLEEDVRQGIAFGDALAKHSDIFPDLFVNMVKVGENSGNLEGNLKLLAIQMKKDHDLNSKVKSAMMYPAVILVAMIGIGIGMMVFVMPKLMAIFLELNVELPLMTRIIIAISNFLTNQWLISVIVFIVFVFGSRMFLKSKQGKNLLDQVILKSPIFGNISKKLNSARMARTLSSLIESSVPIVRALEITGGTLNNHLFTDSLSESAKEVQKGQQLSEILMKYPHLFPPLVTQMIQVGEETGTLGEITKRLAEFYEEEVATITKGLSAIIEPILMIIIGA